MILPWKRVTFSIIQDQYFSHALPNLVFLTRQFTVHTPTLTQPTPQPVAANIIEKKTNKNKRIKSKQKKIFNVTRYSQCTIYFLYI